MRVAPGGFDSVQFACDIVMPHASELLSRPAVGGKDSLVLGASTGNSLSKEDLLLRSPPAGEDHVVLGSDQEDWNTNSSAYGVGQTQSTFLAAQAPRCPPGGTSSISFESVVGGLSAEELLTRPSMGGPSTVDLSQDEILCRLAGANQKNLVARQ